MGKLIWNGADARRVVEGQTIRWLNAAVVVVQNHAKKLISVPGPEPSSPGEPPHKQTGRLRASVGSEVIPNDLTGRVGTNLEYGKCLELGTSRMAARPWLRRSLFESVKALARLRIRPEDSQK